MDSSSHLVLHIVLGISVALLLACGLFLVSKKYTFVPYTVFLIILGMVLSPLQLEIFEVLRLSPETVMLIFLPVLLFESAFNFNFREFKKILAPGFLLASVGLLFSALLIAIPFVYVLEMPFMTAYLFGCVISSTDPIAVLSIFKQLGVPKKLQLLVDGESFLNDATSVVMFRILSVFALGTEQAFGVDSAVNGVYDFIYLIFGGAVFGIICGYVLSLVISKIKNVPAVEITLTLIVAHLIFIGSEDLFHVSGIIAVLAGGLVIGNYGRTKISPQVTENMHQMWDLLVFIVTSIVFLLIGYEINLFSFFDNYKVIFFAVCIMLLARAISVYTIGGLYNVFTKDANWIPLNWLHIVNWGGLRGALPLIVFLSLPETFGYRELFIELTLGIIFFTLFINAVTIQPLMQALKISDLNKANELEIKVAEALVHQNILRHLKRLLDLEEIHENVYQRSVDTTKKHLDAVKNQIKLFTESSDKQYMYEFEKVLRRYCLHLEKSTYQKLFKKNVISETIYNRLKETLILQEECLADDIEQFDKTGIPELKIPKRVGSYGIKMSIKEALLIKLGAVKKKDSAVTRNNYIYHKARLLGDELVLEELKEFETNDLIPRKVLTKLLMMYQELCEYNRETLKKIEKINKKVSVEVEERFVHSEIDALVEDILEELGEDERISAKAVRSLSFASV